MKSTYQLFCLVSAAMIFTCACGRTAAHGEPQVAAQTGAGAITLRQVDIRWATLDSGGYARAMQTLYAGRRGALESLLDDAAIERAALSASADARSYEEEQVGNRVPAVSDAEVRAFYDGDPARFGGRPFEAMRPEIVAYLHERNREAARRRWLAELRHNDRRTRIRLAAPRPPEAIDAADATIGPASAPVTVIHYIDYECPYCREAAPVIDRLQRRYPRQLRVVIRDFPLPQIHPHAVLAAEAARCAADQGAFRRFHAALFSGVAPDRTRIEAVAANLGLDGTAFARCLDSRSHRQAVEDGAMAAHAAGVRSTPTTFINGRMLEGAQPLDALAEVVEQELRAAGIR